MGSRSRPVDLENVKAAPCVQLVEADSSIWTEEGERLKSERSASSQAQLQVSMHRYIGGSHSADRDQSDSTPHLQHWRNFQKGIQEGNCIGLLCDRHFREWRARRPLFRAKPCPLALRWFLQPRGIEVIECPNYRVCVNVAHYGNQLERMTAWWHILATTVAMLDNFQQGVSKRTSAQALTKISFFASF